MEIGLEHLDSKYRWYKINLKDENFHPIDYYFRGLTRRELRIAGTKESKFDAETYILASTIFPIKDWDEMLAGVSLRLLQEVYKASGLDSEGVMWEKSIDWIQSDEGCLEAAAIAMIPSCSPEYLENCDPHSYFKYLIMGKVQWEIMTNTPVFEAFKLKPNQNSSTNNEFQTTRGPRVFPDKGKVEQQVEESFHWHK